MVLARARPPTRWRDPRVNDGGSFCLLTRPATRRSPWQLPTGRQRSASSRSVTSRAAIDVDDDDDIVPIARRRRGRRKRTRIGCLGEMCTPVPSQAD